ncbi:bromodomain-containing protein DDB_G0280777-like [Anastrepha obliqua]|uniref:bromodomain-containing protein DDB_G0280777-like n=1 Tax=Anastrepha obliqua TaxID=95512 RepID=UPI0024099095|nr:bromodomain-containing protein DDB_G0280777-like [Anastrepha obliqua]
MGNGERTGGQKEEEKEEGQQTGISSNQPWAGGASGSNQVPGSSTPKPRETSAECRSAKSNSPSDSLTSAGVMTLEGCKDGKVLFGSCYMPHEEEEQIELRKLVETAAKKKHALLVGTDANAHHTVWDGADRHDRAIKNSTYNQQINPNNEISTSNLQNNSTHNSNEKILKRNSSNENIPNTPTTSFKSTSTLSSNNNYNIHLETGFLSSSSNNDNISTCNINAKENNENTDRTIDLAAINAVDNYTTNTKITSLL